MGANRVFFPQQTLDQWLEQGRIALVDDELHDRAAGRRFRLSSAVHFIAEVAGTEDAHGLVGKVKTLEQVQALGGEHYADSVILGDNAYQVDRGLRRRAAADRPPRRRSSRASAARAAAWSEPTAIRSRLLEQL